MFWGTWHLQSHVSSAHGVQGEVENSPSQLQGRVLIVEDWATGPPVRPEGQGLDAISSQITCAEEGHSSQDLGLEHRVKQRPRTQTDGAACSIARLR